MTAPLDVAKVRALVEAATDGPWWQLMPGKSTWIMGVFRGKDMHVADARGWGDLTGKGHGAHGMSDEEAWKVISGNLALIASAPDLAADWLRLAAENERLRAALAGCVTAIEHADMSDGVCCCGDSMDGHSDPMSCGHAPTDMGEYHAFTVLKAARAALGVKP